MGKIVKDLSQAQKRNHSILLFLILFFILYAGNTYGYSALNSNPKNNTELETILKNCADYCERLTNSALFFVCQEKVEELIYPPPSGTARIVALREKDQIRTYIGTMPRKKREKNVFVYDYQLIRKENKISESRILIEENGQKKHEKDARLKTKLFSHKNIILGPIGLLSKYWQHYHDYRIVKEEKRKGEKVIVVEAVPKPGQKIGHLFGKIWVKKADSSILKIEWNQESIGGYEIVEEMAESLKANPRITLIAEYDFEKKGIRFPSKFSVTEAYIGKGFITPGKRRFINSKTTVTYKDYKFFTVETEVKYSHYPDGQS